MARTPSTMIPLGTIAPEFTLTDAVTGNPMSLNDLKSGAGTVIMFICNHCPYVVHVKDALVDLANDYMPRGISFVAICSNDVENYPEDSPELMKADAERLGYPFPYLYDETQDVARAYHAACTPEFYIFDGGMRCVYRGQLDNSRPANGLPVTGADVRAALDCLIAGTPVGDVQIPSIGCNIKWKAS